MFCGLDIRDFCFGLVVGDAQQLSSSEQPSSWSVPPDAAAAAAAVDIGLMHDGGMIKLEPVLPASESHPLPANKNIKQL